MHILEARHLSQVLDYATLVDALEAAFRCDVAVPPRHHHTVPVADGRDATLLLMPAWDANYLGIKTVTVMPDNGTLDLPGVHANYQLLDRRTGAMLALLDGAELTARRTAAASALASRYLSRPEAARLLVVGTGTLAPHLIGAHASQRALTHVQVWGRRPERAASVVDDVDLPGVNVEAVADLESAVTDADIISCATLSADPLIRGDWMCSGQHLDLVGGFTPQMREADDTTIAKARIFVDTDDAVQTAGDICDPLKSGVITDADILGTLFTLARGEAPAARSTGDEITLFKSAGTAIEDLAGAVLAYERTQG